MRDIRVLRVFTREGEGGNHLGAVTDLSGLGAPGMQAIAAELGYSETIFLDGSAVRIFTPAAELPFAGHPLVGAAWVISDGADGARGVMTCGIGEVGYTVEGGASWIEAAMPGPVSDVGGAAELAQDFGLPPAAGAWTVMMPLQYLVLEADDASAVAAATPDFAAIGDSELDIVYLYARAGASIRARFFAPNLGVPEDPATGSAAVALAAVVAWRGESEGELTIDQGAEVGNPSRIQLRWRSDAASIGGTVREDEPRSL